MNISNPSSRKRQKLELFSSAYFYFLTGATRSSKQSEILRRNIENKNGHICEEMYDSQITHGIYSKNTPWEELSEMKNESIIGSSPKVEFVHIEWLHQCLSQQRLIDTEAYLWNEEKQLLQHQEAAKNIEISIAVSCGKVANQQTKSEWMKPYACQRITTESTLNRQVIQILAQMEEYYILKGDLIRELAYRRVIAVIKAYPYEIKCATEFKQVQSIGAKMVDKIDEILKTGTLSALKKTQTKEVDAVRQFSNIHGVGSQTARVWIQRGIYDLKELEHRQQLGSLSPALTRVQQLGLQYYQDMSHPVTMPEIEQIKSLVQSAVESIVDHDTSKWKIEIAGGIRRGKDSGHDVDILIGLPKELFGREPEMLSLIQHQLAPDPLQCILQSSISSSARHTALTKYKDDHGHHPTVLGLFQVKGSPYLRRVDIVIVPYNEWGFALLGWTGSKQFERSLRKYAKDTKGWSLNNHGFCSQETGGKLSLLSGETEKEIFVALGLDYLEPHQRCC